MTDEREAPPETYTWEELTASPEFRALRPVQGLVEEWRDPDNYVSADAGVRPAAGQRQAADPPQQVGFAESMGRSFMSGAHQLGAALLRTTAALEQPSEPELLPEDDEGIRSHHRMFWGSEPGAAQLAALRKRNQAENARRKADYDEQLAHSDALFARGDAQAELARRGSLQQGEVYTLGGRFGAILGGVVPGFLDMPFSAQQRGIEVLQNGGSVRDAAKAAAIEAPIAAILMEAPVKGGKIADAILGRSGKAARLAGRSAGTAAGSVAALPVQNAADYLATPDGQKKPPLVPTAQQVEEAAAQGLVFGLAGGRKPVQRQAVAQRGAMPGSSADGARIAASGAERPAGSTNRDGLPVRSGDKVGLGAGMAQDGVTSVHDSSMPDSIPALHRSGEQRPFDVRESHDHHERVEKALLDAGHRYSEAHRMATEVEHARMRQLGFDPNEIEQTLAPHLDAAAHEARAKGNTTADVTGEPYQDSGENRMRKDGGEPDPRFILDRDGGRYTEPVHGKLPGQIEAVTARSDDGGHAVIEPNSGMVLARGGSREAAEETAQRVAEWLGRRRLQARIDAEPPRSQQQLREQFQGRYPEGRVGGDDWPPPEKPVAQPEPEVRAPPSEGRGGFEGTTPTDLKREESAAKASGADLARNDVAPLVVSKKPRRRLPEPIRKSIEAGNEFNRSRRASYPHNEVEVLDAAGNKFRLDSYHPNKQEIVSRKFTQLAGIKTETAIGYLREILTKYPSGAIISHSVFNHKHLRGLRMSGKLLLEVPVQDEPVPHPVLDYAKRNNIRIRDTNGVIH